MELEKQLLEDWWPLAGKPRGAGAAGWGHESRGVARGPCSGGSSATEENLWAEPRDAGTGGSLRPWQEALEPGAVPGGGFPAQLPRPHGLK